MNKRVFLGVGHGGRDPGAMAHGLKEKDMNLVTALATKRELERHGVVVGISRTTDEDDSLYEQISECNAFGADLALDIHNNAGGGDGFEAYYELRGGLSLELAKAIEAEVKTIGQNSRGCKTKINGQGQDWFGWIRQTNCPAVLVEGAFLDSDDRFIADTTEELETFGIAYAKGILKVLGIAWQPEQPPQVDQPSKLYRVQVGAFSIKNNAEALAKKLKSEGYQAIIV